ncbi:MAG: two-component system, OmpR family, alkaline phosphatase synthesis response regulator PhoP [Candidatus Methanomethylophilaceae archaeon]|nr:two-component system, OmpR family, alkaline phosphatase synthesis response regulator PhoP [Candidatus Methanomethylophilaceae archaeon]MDI3542020.1 two-component system, OmpR family, alkaline phosphatase synthesis response regulator PhoP [Candidatus Methanomethylophilaceae archaeon]
MKVLIIDDNVAIQEIVSEILATEGHVVAAVGTGKDAFNKIRQFRPDIVFLDINLPDMDGWSVLRKMKEDGLTDGLRVLMFTADTDIGTEIFGLQDVVDGYIRKPFKGNELLEKVKAIEASDPEDRTKGKFKFRSLFGRKDEKSTTPIYRKLNLKGGKSYIVMEKKPQRIYEGFVSELMEGKTGLVVTSEHPKAVREKWGLEKTPIIWLTSRTGKAYVDPTKLGSITSSISQFIENSRNSVILIDGLDTLMLNNEFNQVLKMINQLEDLLVDNNAVLLISVNHQLFDQKELALLQRNKEVLDFMDE